MPVESSSSMLWKQIKAAWRLKLLVAVILPVAFCVPYFFLEHFQMFPVRSLPLWWLDRAVPFRPGWTVAYLSFHVIVYLLPWVGKSRGDMWRFGIGFFFLTSLSFICFLFFPVVGPRPMDTGNSWLYRVVISYDKPLNSFPSLHAGLLVYTLAFGRRMTREKIPRWIDVIMLTWAAMIFYSTLATKEHYAVDLLAGGLVGIACDVIAWHSSIRVMPPLEKS